MVCHVLVAPTQGPVWASSRSRGMFLGICRCQGLVSRWNDSDTREQWIWCCATKAKRRESLSMSLSGDSCDKIKINSQQMLLAWTEGKCLGFCRNETQSREMLLLVHVSLPHSPDPSILQWPLSLVPLQIYRESLGLWISATAILLRRWQKKPCLIYFMWSFL